MRCSRLALLVFAGLVALTPLPSSARATAEEPLVVDLSRHLVEITTGFSGTDLLLFGATDPGGGTESADVVVVVSGPAEAQTIRRKDSVAGLWINSGSARIEGAPAFFRVASTRPLEQVASSALLQRLGIGLDQRNLDIRVEDDGSDAVAYRAALMRLMRARGQYDDRIATIARPGRRLFRTEIHFPATVPVGIYKVEIHLINQGRLIGTQETPLAVDRVGLGAAIHDFAYRQSGLYGLAAVVLAACTGWLAAWLFRKG
ncbi:TIGR02186 family protein [Magnetospirillum molischianum]|uniref:Transmembrane protein n=1 Tax=Magnetospirillum molischianum DSM 120 TaxID=1150626 RepID=H8FVQ8_MAGML|nr:TIGR02186 family protein [Magnetospirillum molischianum]CCG42446.1 conserved exported hypothetical protein [Magnetospirillum molischianum DSM 120]